MVFLFKSGLLAPFFLVNDNLSGFIHKIAFDLGNLYALYKFGLVVYGSVFQILALREETVGRESSR